MKKDLHHLAVEIYLQTKVGITSGMSRAQICKEIELKLGDPVLGPFPQQTLREFVIESRTKFLQEALEKHDYNISKTAKSLEMFRTHLYKDMETYGLRRPEK